jgi:hypothetical protein
VSKTRVSATPVANLQQISMTPLANIATGTAGVDDIDGKFATGINDTGSKPVSTTTGANNRKIITLVTP